MTPHVEPAKARDSYQVVMPKLGLTMTEATLIEWLRAEGEWVEKGKPLFVLESEKSMLEIESPASGILQILVPVGETVPVHTPIAKLSQSTEAGIQKPEPEHPAQEATGHHESQIPARASRRTPHESRIPASPKARALARTLGVPLAEITGTGARGMIVAADVERVASLPSLGVEAVAQASPVARRIAANAGLDLSTIAGTGPGGRIMRQDVEHALLPGGEVARRDEVQEIQPLAGLRAIVAERLSSSWQERPHVSLTTEADATNLISARQQAMAETGAKVSYDALLVALVARALYEHPHVNVRLTERGIEHLSQVNVGVAVDTERGLVVPVVRNAAVKSLPQIQQTLGELVERALAGRSLPDDLTGGTFTITNLGMFEIDAFSPIINPPESAILGVGRIVAKPVAVERQVVVRDMVTLSLSFDHRLVDGAPAARFLQRLKKLVERPFALALGEDEPSREP
jgi:pyruvate dehydrogenase E2 component (dihydrolipoamide acetyltransferase)